MLGFSVSLFWIAQEPHSIYNGSKIPSIEVYSCTMRSLNQLLYENHVQKAVSHEDPMTKKNIIWFSNKGTIMSEHGCWHSSLHAEMKKAMQEEFTGSNLHKPFLSYCCQWGRDYHQYLYSWWQPGKHHPHSSQLDTVWKLDQDIYIKRRRKKSQEWSTQLPSKIYLYMLSLNNDQYPSIPDCKKETHTIRHSVIQVQTPER